MSNKNGFDVRLESLRGIAALAVLLAHGTAILRVDGLAAYWALPLSEQTPASSALVVLGAVFNPSAAVVLFFVLSGYVLSLSLERGTQRSSLQSCAGSSGSCLRCGRRSRSWPSWCGLCRLPLAPVSDYFTDFYRPLWLRAAALNLVLLDFRTNPVTWTLYVELVGSAFLLFAVSQRWALLVATALAAYAFYPSLTLSYLVSFQAGVMLAAYRDQTLRWKVPVALIGIGTFIAERLILREGLPGFS